MIRCLPLLIVAIAAIGAVPVDPPESIPLPPEHHSLIPSVETDSLIYDSADSKSLLEGNMGHTRVKRAEDDDDEEKEEEESYWTSAWNNFKNSFFCTGENYWDMVARKKKEQEERWRAEFNLPVSPGSILVAGRPGLAPFDSVLGSNYCIHLIAAAHSSNLNSCISFISKKTAKILDYMTLDCDHNNGTCLAYIAEFPKEKAIALVFRYAPQKDYGCYNVTYSTGEHPPQEVQSGGRVNAYTANYFGVLWLQFLQKAVAEQLALHPDFSLWITGHGVGGSMATVAASTIASGGNWPVKKMMLITYGAPRTGDYEFAKGFHKLRVAAYRVVHKQDYLVHMRPSDNSTWLEFPRDAPHLNYYIPEVFYDNDMKDMKKFEMCKRKRRSQCSDKYAETPHHEAIEDQQMYYDVNIRQYGENNCLE